MGAETARHHHDEHEAEHRGNRGRGRVEDPAAGERADVAVG
jgi:hypothetical protein